MPACACSASSALLVGPWARSVHPAFGIEHTARTLERVACIRHEQRCRLHSVRTMQLGSSDPPAGPRPLERGGRACECRRCACYRRRHAAAAGTRGATVHRVPRAPACTAGASEAAPTPLSGPNACVCPCVVECRMDRQGPTATSMIGVAQVILRVTSAVPFPSDVFVACAAGCLAGVPTLLRSLSPHVDRPKHTPALTVTHGVGSVSFCMRARA